ncbi:hypothetical protein GCM10007939_19060 [Amylibacter marinus]|uniref:GST N-terminal domain-containing protein n=1 Tax=Amylibacter marinus TaxID=1475483 RepID=A0ABQ5VWZ5_9RHOB|nr:glutathione S-transferase N-terminal domain-containing protein [Amylibacter marinus]GLQ35623.1 hypothetical protein GCM10007939_19060 [Amylibacter marinus]
MESAKLYYLDVSPFARVCRALIYDWEIPVSPERVEFPLPDSFFELNPLGQVPVLETVGETIYPTQPIIDQLWAMTTGANTPHYDPLADRQMLQTIFTMGDMIVTSSQIVRSGLRPSGENLLGFDMVERHQKRIDNVLDMLEENAPNWLLYDKVSVCDYALAAVLLYADFRRPFNWRHREKLAGIVDHIAASDSFGRTNPRP